MIAINNCITVKVDLSQNEEFLFCEKKLFSGRNYNENFRERSPVIATVLDGGENIITGSKIVCNYNHFQDGSPYEMYDNIFSIPVNEEIFAIINNEGDLMPINGNILIERVTKETKIELPDDFKKPHYNQGVVSIGNNRFKKGQYIFWLKMADYEIVYNWHGIEKRAIKIHESEIIGYLKN